MLYYGLEWQSLDSYFQFKEITEPATPQSGEIRLFAEDDGGISTLCYKNDAGTKVCFPTSGTFVTGGGVAGRVAFWDSASNLSSDADLTFAVDTLTATKIVIPTSATFSFLTAGRIPFAGTAGLLTDDATLTFTKSDGDFQAAILLGGDSHTGVINGPAGVTINIDSNNNDTGALFAVQTNTALRLTGGTRLFTINESGAFGVGSGVSFGTSGQFLASAGNAAAPTWTTHDSTGDPHTQYALLVGRASGQILIGGTASLESLTLQGSSHADGGLIVLNNDSIAATASDTAGVKVSPTFTGSGNVVRGIQSLTTFQPSGNIGAGVAFSFAGIGNPTTGITIALLAGGAGAYQTGSDGGAITSAYGFYIDVPTLGSVKPTNSFGLNIENQGASSITRAAGLRIGAQSGATENYNVWAIGGTDKNIVLAGAPDMGGAGMAFSVVNDAFSAFAPLHFRASEYNFFDAVCRTSSSGTQKNRFRYLNSIVQVYKSATQTISDATNTAVAYAAEYFDTDGLHDNVTENTKLTAAIAGKYAVFATVEWDSNDTGFRQLAFRVNGTTYVAVDRRNAVVGEHTFNSLSTEVNLAASEYVEVIVYQNSTGNLDLSANVYDTFGMYYIGE